MSNNKMILIVGIVAVVLLAGVGAYFMLSDDDSVDKGGNDGDDKTPVDPDDDKVVEVRDINIINDTRNLVYGNANHDDYLDKEDVKFVQSIVDGKTKWNKEKNPLADANIDGKITSKDVDMIKKMLSGETMTIHYANWYGEVADVSFPLKGNMIGAHTQCLDVGIILGVLDDFVGIRDTPQVIEKYDETFYPDCRKLVSVRGEPHFDIEKILSIGTDIILSDRFAFTEDFLNKIHKADPTIQCIELPINREVNGIDWTHTVVTLGVMMDIQDRTKDYIDYVNNIEADISSKLASLDKDKKTFVIAYMPKSATSTGIEILGTGIEQYGDVINMLRIPLVNAVDPMAENGYIKNYEIEKIIDLDPDVIFVETYNLLRTMSPQDYEKKLDEMVGWFKESGAYKNGNVITYAFDVYGTTPGLSGMPLIASLIWPGCFTAEEAEHYLNEYFQKFTNVGPDTNVSEIYGYLPERHGPN